MGRCKLGPPGVGASGLESAPSDRCSVVFLNREKPPRTTIGNSAETSDRTVRLRRSSAALTTATVVALAVRNFEPPAHADVRHDWLPERVRAELAAPPRTLFERLGMCREDVWPRNGLGWIGVC